MFFQPLCMVSQTQKSWGGDEGGSEPPQSATHDGIGVDSDDREEDGEAGTPYDGIEGGGYEVIGCDAIEPGEFVRVVHVHEHASNLYK